MLKSTTFLQSLFLVSVGDFFFFFFFFFPLSCKPRKSFSDRKTNGQTLREREREREREGGGEGVGRDGGREGGGRGGGGVSELMQESLGER